MSTNLPKIVSRRNKRLGQGRGSGKGGHTSGRGQKGQKSRGDMNILFEGLKVKKSLFKRLPVMRGKGKFSVASKAKLIVTLSMLELLPKDATVNVETLAKYGIVDKKDAEATGVKILGNGKVEKKFKVEVPISKSAAKKIEEAGGEIVNK